jgi:hypothetical protein
MERQPSAEARYAVIEVEKLRAISTHSQEEVLHAQKKVDREMIDALEQMISMAKEEALLGTAALKSRAVAW